MASVERRLSEHLMGEDVLLPVVLACGCGGFWSAARIQRVAGSRCLCEDLVFLHRG